MNSTDHAHQKGDSICRPTDWTDICKFFLLNYGLHAVTVVQRPGSTRLLTIMSTIMAILMPSVGLESALVVLLSPRRWGETDLQTARRAGALCMVIPSAVADKFRWKQISINLVQVHGQYPLTDQKLTEQTTIDLENKDERMPTENPDLTTLDHCCLVMVPPYFDVFPLVEEPQSDSAAKPELGFISRAVKGFADIFRSRPAGVTQLSLACNYSAVKVVSAIIQILYACFELYKARGDQLDRYGYAAYSLTIIPYISMSLMNLLASLWVPQYPSRFLVYYRGSNPTARLRDQGEIHPDWSDESLWLNGRGQEWKSVEAGITSAVGVAYGDLMIDPKARSRAMGEKLQRNLLQIVFVGLLCYCVYAAPYIIMKVLTNFKQGHSTLSQRSWVMGWIVMGQMGTTITFLITRWLPSDMIRIRGHPIDAYFIYFVVMIILSPSTIGGFVVVAQMMSTDQVCTTI